MQCSSIHTQLLSISRVLIRFVLAKLVGSNRSPENGTFGLFLPSPSPAVCRRTHFSLLFQPCPTQQQPAAAASWTFSIESLDSPAIVVAAPLVTITPGWRRPNYSYPQRSLAAPSPATSFDHLIWALDITSMKNHSSSSSPDNSNNNKVVIMVIDENPKDLDSKKKKIRMINNNKSNARWCDSTHHEIPPNSSPPTTTTNNVH